MVYEDVSNPTHLPAPPIGWRTMAIEDLCANVTSGGTPLRSNKTFYHGGTHSWFKTQELRDRILFESEEKITTEALEKSSAKLFPKNTVLMAMYGDGKTITSVGILAKEAATNQACCAMIPERNICNPRFLFYALMSHRDDFIRIASGGAQRNLSGRLIRRFAINVPPLPEQCAIANILGMLDDKIELNQQMNETLEAIGKSIFNHWFVDFEFPNKESKPYKSSGGEMIRSEELGKEIPTEWKLGTINEIAIQSRDQISPYEHPEKIYNHFSIEAYDSGMKPLSHLGSDILSNKFVVHENTVLVSKLNPRIPRIWPILNVKENSICSTEFLVFKPKNNLFCYFYYLLSLSCVKKNLMQMARGTSSSHQRVSVYDILKIPIIIPPQKILEMFEKIIFTNLTKMEQNRNNQLTLTDIRNLLLPKLMSGKIRVLVEAKLHAKSNN